jgi:hypothetical protein
MPSNFNYQMENLILWFQGGVRRSVLIFAGVCMLLIVPFFFLGTVISNFWSTTPINPSKNDLNTKYASKVIPEKDLIISSSQNIAMLDGTKVIYVSLDNKANTEVGYYPFVYNLQILDDNGSLIKEEVGLETYILPQSVKFLTVSADSRASKINIQKTNRTQKVLFNQNSKRKKDVNLVVLEPKVEDITFTNNLKISGKIRNSDTAFVRKFDILYTIRDTRQLVSGIGYLGIENLAPGEERRFELLYPKAEGRTATVLEVLPIINYLDENNIVI